MARSRVAVDRADATDAAEVVSLWSAAGVEGASGLGLPEQAGLPAWLAAVCRDGRARLLLARVDGWVVGSVLATVAPASVPVRAPCVHLEHLVVHREYRRRGVGRALMAAVVALAEDEGAEQLMVNVAPSAREANRFFARFGFSPEAVRRVVSTSRLRRRLAVTGPLGASRAGAPARRPQGSVATRVRARAALLRMSASAQSTAKPEPVGRHGG